MFVSVVLLCMVGPLTVAGNWCTDMEASQNWFVCKDNKEPWCIHPALWCTGQADCQDGSDEQNCDDKGEGKTPPGADHRSSSTMCVGCTSFERKILDKHNTLRRQESSSNMNELQWSSAAASQAAAWAAQCKEPKLGDNPHGMMSPDYGQNVARTYWTTRTEDDIVDLVQLFYDEKSSWNYDSNSCQAGAVCGHYLAMTAAYERELGCAYTKCDRGSFKFYNLVCDYRPWPNWTVWNLAIDQPFRKGAACSECQPGLQCRDNLCA